jgi:heptosyltransferase III
VRRRLRDLRRAARRALGMVLAPSAGARAAAPCALEPGAIGRVLVCRLNRRLGNLVLLTPLLRSLARSLPQCRIDLLISGPHAELFRSMPGIEHVERLRTGRRTGLLPLAALLRRLRARRYDLAIDPCLSSTSGRLAVSLCGARWRLGFSGPAQWARLSHSVEPHERLTHEALRPLELLRAAFREEDLRLEPRLGLELSAAEREAGREALCSTLGPAQGRAVGFFRDAAGAKRLDAGWWGVWSRTMSSVPGLRLVEIAAPASSSDAPDSTPARRYSEADPRRLAAVLGELEGFVCADTGPMHLASASGVPTIGLFHTSDPVQYAPYGPRDLVLDLRRLGPEQAALRCVRHLETPAVLTPSRPRT